MAKSNSTNNSLHHVLSSSQISCSRGGGGSDQSPEESGWTMYFEDFLNSSNQYPDDHREQLSSFSSDDVTPDDDHTHVAPDAASSVVGDNDGAAVAAPGFSCKDMNGFKKRRMMIKELFVEDESLEDTASSPVNSPKVSDSTYFSKNQKQKENLIAPQVEERPREMGFVGMGSEYTQLKKRGLCLVPLSMVVNYLAE